MPVTRTDLSRWTAPISYVIGHLDTVSAAWVVSGVDAFNAAVGEPVFRPAAPGQPGQVQFVEASRGESPGGDQQVAGGQEIRFHSRGDEAPYRTLWHEMGHCVGLSHEQFHPGYPLRPLLLTLQEKVGPGNVNLAGALNDKGLQVLGAYDKKSIMMYPLASILDDGMVEFVADLKDPRVITREPFKPSATPARRGSTGGKASAKEAVVPASAPDAESAKTRAERAATPPSLPRLQAPMEYREVNSELSPGDVAAIRALVGLPVRPVAQ